MQPAVKCRGKEYLRIIYGPEYAIEDNHVRPSVSGVGAKRAVARRKFALGMEGLEPFVRKEPLRRVHQCAFAVLESDPSSDSCLAPNTTTSSPAVILRFSTSDGELCMYDKSTAKWINTHASNAAVRSDFYTVDLVNEGASDEVERALGNIEGRMTTALTHFDEGKWPPDEQDRQAIGGFVGLQSVRGPDFRESSQDSYDRVGQKMADLIVATGAGLRKAFAEEHGRVPTEEEFQELQQSMTRMEVRAEIPRNYHVTLMLETAEEQALVVYAKQLHVLSAPEDSNFVTADVPLALWSEVPGPFGAISVMMAHEVCLPIDRYRCLMLNHPAGEEDRGFGPPPV